jgi:hypothetical protein
MESCFNKTNFLNIFFILINKYFHIKTEINFQVSASRQENPAASSRGLGQPNEGQEVKPKV